MLLSENLIGLWPLCSLTLTWFLNCGFFKNVLAASAGLAPTCCRQRCKVKLNWWGHCVCSTNFCAAKTFLSLSNPHSGVSYFAGSLSNTDKLHWRTAFFVISSLLYANSCTLFARSKYIWFDLHFNSDDETGEMYLIRSFLTVLFYVIQNVNCKSLKEAVK